MLNFSETCQLIHQVFEQNIRSVFLGSILAFPAAPGACPEAAHSPWNPGESYEPAHKRGQHASIFHQQPSPAQWCPHVSPHVNFKPRDSRNSLYLCVTRSPAYAFSVPGKALLSTLKTVWEFPTREGCMELNHLSPYRHNLDFYLLLYKNGYQENPTVSFRPWQTSKSRYEFSLPFYFQGYQ